jgi:hypothetical protein
LSGLTLGDFWSWAYSDVLSNLNLSTLAEFLVASTPGVIDQPRVEWDAVDLHYQGRGIEVKSAAHLQSWEQENESVVRYDIAKKIGWDAEANHSASEPTRSADCYVWAFPEKDPDEVNVLDARAWEFYVLSTAQIERELGKQKSVGIRRLKTLCSPVRYGKLKDRTEIALAL